MDAWTTLGVARNAPDDALKAAWRAAARRHHPDLGGDAAAFVAAQEAWDTIKRSQPPPRSSGRAAGVERENAEPRPWNHLRAVEYLVEIDGLDVDTMEDGTTGFAGPGGVIWVSDADVEWEGYGVPWPAVDDKIMADVVELLLVGPDA